MKTYFLILFSDLNSPLPAPYTSTTFTGFHLIIGNRPIIGFPRNQCSACGSGLQLLTAGFYLSVVAVMRGYPLQQHYTAGATSAEVVSGRRGKTFSAFVAASKSAATIATTDWEMIVDGLQMDKRSSGF